MIYKRIFLAFCIGFLALQSMACGDKAAKKVSTEAPREGRDKELYADALKALQHHRYEEGRLLLNTLISTYDNSPILPLAKLLIADSFYREGGTSNLAQSEVEYREWLQFFPNHPLAPAVLLKIGQIHVRQIGPANQDWSQGLAAERELLRLQKEYPQSDLNPQVKEYLTFVREVLGMHELSIMRFYFSNRKAWTGVIQRGLAILKKYPDFTYTDEVLYLLGSALVEKEDTPEAGKYFGRLVREYPNSEWRDKAAEFLERFGVAVPDPAPGATEKVVQRKGFITRKREELFGSHMKVPNDGIVLTKDDELDPEVAKLFNLPKIDLPTPDATQTTTKGVTTYNPNDDSKAADAAKPNGSDDKKTPADTPTTKDKNKKKIGLFGKILGRG